MKVTDQSKAYARAALDYIEQHPEQHNQADWIKGVLQSSTNAGCGTSMCVAGTINFLKNGLDARYHDSEGTAAEILGLTSGEVDILFYEMDNDRAKAKLNKVANGEQFTEEDYYKAGDAGSEPYFDECAWDRRDDDYPIFY